LSPFYSFQYVLSTEVFGTSFIQTACQRRSVSLGTDYYAAHSELFNLIDSTGVAGSVIVVNSLLGDSAHYLSLEDDGRLLLEAAARLTVKLPSYIYDQIHWESFANVMLSRSKVQMSVRLPEAN
jgi:hypothetical protein